MNELMIPIPFPDLMEWIRREKEDHGTVFGVEKPFVTGLNTYDILFHRHLELPCGPAAGPHTQLAQNIIAAYYAGARFFELKTIQIMDGEDLQIEKPCIDVGDLGYNVEWSTELTIAQAFEEYVKAWFAISVISKEYHLGAIDGFQFNMSVGYDYDGITSQKVDSFITSMQDASNTDIFLQCTQYLLAHIQNYSNLTSEDILSISPHISSSITLSTLHGCPSKQIEKIVSYLLQTKKLNTIIKCNPTLIGYKEARHIFDELGLDDVEFSQEHFDGDLQFDKAVDMIRRLKELAESNHLMVGIKLTNTVPIKNTRKELAGTEMYLSGKVLYPIGITIARRFAEEFNGKIMISFSGGVEQRNVKELLEAGIWPITMVTTLLKPGGYQRLYYIADQIKSEVGTLIKEQIKIDKLNAILDHIPLKPMYFRQQMSKSLKVTKEIAPMFDCAIAPCSRACPIHQSIPEYLKLLSEGKSKEAFSLITEENPMPYTTGTICSHPCMEVCTRNYYDEPVDIRGCKLVASGLALRHGIEPMEYEKILRTSWNTRKTCAVIGGGPAGISIAFFLASKGVDTTIYEREQELGGLVRNVIPEFRITESVIEKDIELLKTTGVHIIRGCKIECLDEIREEYDYIVLAIGTGESRKLAIESDHHMTAINFLKRLKRDKESINLGKNIAVIGGGNTAIDVARSLKRCDGVEQVNIVYRRSIHDMPAAEEEIMACLKEEIMINQQLLPMMHKEGILYCNQCRLGALDSSGRRIPITTGKILELEADYIISAIGEQLPITFYRKNGIKILKEEQPDVNPLTYESNLYRVYVIGDAIRGSGTIVDSIRDAKLCSEEILRQATSKTENLFNKTENLFNKVTVQLTNSRIGKIEQKCTLSKEENRCLRCDQICEHCVQVCPNRANVAIHVSGMVKRQILHIDSLCNRCGNCKNFCPYQGAPYEVKFTLFDSMERLNNSECPGFFVEDKSKQILWVRYQHGESQLERIMLRDRYKQAIDSSYDRQGMVISFLHTILEEYPYLN